MPRTCLGHHLFPSLFLSLFLTWTSEMRLFVREPLPWISGQLHKRRTQDTCLWTWTHFRGGMSPWKTQEPDRVLGRFPGSLDLGTWDSVSHPAGWGRWHSPWAWADAWAERGTGSRRTWTPTPPPPRGPCSLLGARGPLALPWHSARGAPAAESWGRGRPEHPRRKDQGGGDSPAGRQSRTSVGVTRPPRQAPAARGGNGAVAASPAPPEQPGPASAPTAAHRRPHLPAHVQQRVIVFIVQLLLAQGRRHLRNLSPRQTGKAVLKRDRPFAVQTAWAREAAPQRPLAARSRAATAQPGRSAPAPCAPARPGAGRGASGPSTCCARI